MGRVRPGVRQDGRHELRCAPFQAVGTRRILHPLAHLVLDAWSITPHGPELAVVMGEVGVQVVAAMLEERRLRVWVRHRFRGSQVAHIAHHCMLARHLRERVKVELMGILRHPRPREHDERGRIGRRMGRARSGVGMVAERRRDGGLDESLEQREDGDTKRKLHGGGRPTIRACRPRANENNLARRGKR